MPGRNRSARDTGHTVQVAVRLPSDLYEAVRYGPISAVMIAALRAYLAMQPPAAPAFDGIVTHADL